MNQDQYLQRLRNIREKYTSTNKTPQFLNHDLQFRHPLNQPTYPRFQNHTPSQLIPQYEHSRSIPPKADRSYCLVQQSIVIPQQKNEQYGNGYDSKRMENFNTFIQDLDKRIVEKERALSSKIRNNEKTIKPKDQHQYDLPLTRYNSSKDIHKNIVEPSRVVPRQSYYERSLQKRQEIPREAYARSLQKRQPIQYRKSYNPQVDNGILQRKWVQDNYSNQKLKILNGYKDSKQKNPQQPIPLSLNKNENIVNNDFWSLGKLDNIQQRIKSVLQRNH